MVLRGGLPGWDWNCQGSNARVIEQQQSVRPISASRCLDGMQRRSWTVHRPLPCTFPATIVTTTTITTNTTANTHFSTTIWHRSKLASSCTSLLLHRGSTLNRGRRTPSNPALSERLPTFFTAYIGPFSFEGER